MIGFILALIAKVLGVHMSDSAKDLIRIDLKGVDWGFAELRFA